MSASVTPAATRKRTAVKKTAAKKTAAKTTKTATKKTAAPLSQRAISQRLGKIAAAIGPRVRTMTSLSVEIGREVAVASDIFDKGSKTAKTALGGFAGYFGSLLGIEAGEVYRLRTMGRAAMLAGDAAEDLSATALAAISVFHGREDGPKEVAAVLAATSKKKGGPTEANVRSAHESLFPDVQGKRGPKKDAVPKGLSPEARKKLQGTLSEIVTKTAALGLSRASVLALIRYGFDLSQNHGPVARSLIR